MRLKRHVPFLESTLKHVTARPLVSALSNRCRYASSSVSYPENIAVAGGGISGLASAYFVSKEFPKSKITVYERGKETGGWIRSRRVEVPGGNVLFEHGPRTLRPGAASMATAHLIQELGLVEDVVYTKHTAPAAANRFIYYPDRLNRIPSPEGPLTVPEMFSLARSGILSGALQAFFEPWNKSRPATMTDESIGSFLSRRFDKRLVNNIASAVMHGIYAGDIWQLSAKTLFANAWQLEGRYGSIVRGFIKVNQESEGREPVSLYHPYDLDALVAMRDEFRLEDKFVTQLQRASMFTFRNGLQALVKALQRNLEENPQVEIKLGCPILSKTMAKGGEQWVEVTSGGGIKQSTQKYDLVVSTFRHGPLTDFVTVMTVNLYYPKTGILPVQGFGYLIPQSVPFEQNPERALGVIFDSDAVTGQDTASGTKLTVMLGGHWWSTWEHFPDPEEGVELAKSVLRRHLGIKDEPLKTHVNLSRDCIPQYTVGYEERLRDLANKIQNDFRGRMRIVGNQFHGVGVNDCIRAAWLLARGLRGNGWRERGTGLERVLDERSWVTAPSRQSYRKIDIHG